MLDAAYDYRLVIDALARPGLPLSHFRSPPEQQGGRRMRMTGTAQQTAVGLARHDAHDPPRQIAPCRPVSYPATVTTVGHSANPSRDAISLHSVSTTSLSQPELIEYLHKPFPLGHYSRRTGKTVCHWVKRSVCLGVDLSDLLPVQVGLLKGGESCNVIPRYDSRREDARRE